MKSHNQIVVLFSLTICTFGNYPDGDKYEPSKVEGKWCVMKCSEDYSDYVSCPVIQLKMKKDDAMDVEATYADPNTKEENKQSVTLTRSPNNDREYTGAGTAKVLSFPIPYYATVAVLYVDYDKKFLFLHVVCTSFMIEVANFDAILHRDCSDEKSLSAASDRLIDEGNEKEKKEYYDVYSSTCT